MHTTKAPCGSIINVPSDVSEDFEYFTIRDLTQAVAYYKENGYVVIRGAVEKKYLAEVNKSFDQEVLNYKGYLYRQTGGNPEINKYNDQGHLINPLLNIQDLPSNTIGKFRSQALQLLTAPVFKNFANALWNRKPMLVQSMYFHGNSETWAHQDSYYLDSQNFGDMFAGWLAAEDIHPGAGRFFIYPKSHKLGLMKNTGHLSVSGNHNAYKKEIVSWMQDNSMICKAPALNQGDLLIWNANTVHGSLGTSVSGKTRRSITCHYIPDGDDFIQFHARKVPLKLSELNDIRFHSPKSLDKLSRRGILWIETTFPKSFRTLKWTAIKFLTK